MKHSSIFFCHLFLTNQFFLSFFIKREKTLIALYIWHTEGEQMEEKFFLNTPIGIMLETETERERKNRNGIN